MGRPRFRDPPPRRSGVPALLTSGTGPPRIASASGGGAAGGGAGGGGGGSAGPGKDGEPLGGTGTPTAGAAGSLVAALSPASLVICRVPWSSVKRLMAAGTGQGRRIAKTRAERRLLTPTLSLPLFSRIFSIKPWGPKALLLSFPPVAYNFNESRGKNQDGHIGRQALVLTPRS